MTKQKIANGVVHKTPVDLRKALMADQAALAEWADITPLARNEWICWVENAKQKETRKRRIALTCTKLAQGTRRPCCWPGCTHR